GMVVADYRSEGDTANESISVNSPAAGTYYIGFLLWTTNTAVTSTVTATITTGSTSNLAGNTLVVPQFINGGGWTTVLFLTNTSSSSENYTIRFFDNTGAPRQVAIQGSGTINTLTGSVSPGQIAVFQTSDAGTLALGWAAVIPGTANATRLNMFTVF